MRSVAFPLGNCLESDHARDFLDQVRLNGDVKAMRRRRDFPSAWNCAHLHLQSGEHAGDAVGIDARPKEARELRPSQAHWETPGLVLARVKLRHRPRLAPCNLNQEGARTFD